MNFKGSSSFLAARWTISSGHRIPSEWPSIASVPSRGNLDDPRSEGGMKDSDWPGVSNIYCVSICFQCFLGGMG